MSSVKVPTDLSEEAVLEALTSIIEGYHKKKSEETLTSTDIDNALDQLTKYNIAYPDIIETYINKAYLEGDLFLLDEAAKTLRAGQKLDEERIGIMLAGLQEIVNDEEISTIFISEEGEINQKFERALEEIFERFSTNKKSLSDDDLNTFHVAVNGEPMPVSGFDFLKSGNFELDENQCLTLEGFKEFYVNQTMSVPSETLSDLKKLGYNELLEKEEKQ